MPSDTSREQDPDDIEPEFVEVDPNGRYGRYKEVLGKGAFKKVYRAFDELEGIEVAWNQVKVSELLRNAEDLERLYAEVYLLKTLKHKNIIKFYNSWVDTQNEHINFITEIFTSGTLRQYRKKHKHVDLRALKKWSRQILEGLEYLHSLDPPVIHRDLKCDNIFVNGNHGEVKIGDLGLAAILHHANAAHSVIGTPEFMAPELYEEEYNELVDIYAFGMCLLELVTFEYPYIECSNAAQIYRKVTSGIKPASLAKVTDPDVKAFIEKCITNVSERLSASELLRDPFLLDADHENRSLHVNLRHSEVAHQQSHIGASELEDSYSGLSRDLSVHGERKDVDTVFIKLRITDSKGPCRNIHFPFDIEADTSIAVASEMVHELDLTDQDIPTIADMIDSEIRALIPDWSPRESSGEGSAFDSPTSDAKEDNTPLHVSENNNSNMSTPTKVSGGFCFFRDQLPSGRKFWSDAPRSSSGPSIVKSNVPESPSEDHTPHDKKLREISESSILNDQKADEIAYDNNPATIGETSGSSEKDELTQNGECEKDGLGESDELRTIADKLDLLLAEQHKELDELKWKHEQAVSDIVKELPSQMRLKVFNMCSRKIPDYKLHCKMNLSGHANNGLYNWSSVPVRKMFRSASTIDVAGSPRVFHVVTKVGTHGVGPDGPGLRDKLNSFKRESSSDMGIAVILKDDPEDS